MHRIKVPIGCLGCLKHGIKAPIKHFGYLKHGIKARAPLAAHRHASPRVCIQRSTRRSRYVFFSMSGSAACMEGNVGAMRGFATGGGVTGGNGR